MANFYSVLRDGIQKAVYVLIDKPIALAVKIGLTPNGITTLGLLGNILAAGLFVLATLYPEHQYAFIGWGGATILLSSIMDMVDGRMARTCDLCSTFGAFYDSVLDRYCELLTLAGIVYYFFAVGEEWMALVTLLSLIGSIMVSYVRARAEGLGIECKVGLMQRPERVVLTCLGAVLCGALAPVVPFHPLWLLVTPQIIIAVLANITAFHRILHVGKQCS
ncbi:MAG: CDP-alcohol phosphatidyltransferase family protein [Bacteroidaceae bacterium]|nr:CDP-alcohol phosphatidyltransferase family protein [Bacteroidaceae bacterium]